MNLCTKKNRISVGSIVSVAAAIRFPQSVVYCCINIRMPTGRVSELYVLRNTLPMKNSL